MHTMFFTSLNMSVSCPLTASDENDVVTPRHAYRVSPFPRKHWDAGTKLWSKNSLRRRKDDDPNDNVKEPQQTKQQQNVD